MENQLLTDFLFTRNNDMHKCCLQEQEQCPQQNILFFTVEGEMSDAQTHSHTQSNVYNYHDPGRAYMGR
eukprot:m.110204 g.110204  ORF g.110204 m.110204 type:complete len:69 (+) comp15264_c0_seq1:336-542(+)